ncbi:MAG: hypothetical protein IKL10_04860 [Clostridia bacterium]|nr:hypothetical protein [Clostridia bacterium]
MDNKYNELLEKIASQQKGKEFTDVFMVGEQLKDICRNNGKATELVLADLDVPEMSLEKCAAEIKKEADRLHKEKKGSCICVPPNVAEGIIRKFYGIPDDSESVERKPEKSSNIINLEDFI